MLWRLSAAATAAIPPASFRARRVADRHLPKGPARSPRRSAATLIRRFRFGFIGNRVGHEYLPGWVLLIRSRTQDVDRNYPQNRRINRLKPRNRWETTRTGKLGALTSRGAIRVKTKHTPCLPKKRQRSSASACYLHGCLKLTHAKLMFSSPPPGATPLADRPRQLRTHQVRDARGHARAIAAGEAREIRDILAAVTPGGASRCCR